MKFPSLLKQCDFSHSPKFFDSYSIHFVIKFLSSLSAQNLGKIPSSSNHNSN